MKIILKVVYYIGGILSNIYTLNMSLYLDKIYTSFHSGWLVKAFKSCGKNISISGPFYCGGQKYISIGNNFIAGPRMRLEAYDTAGGFFFTPSIIIGNDVNINSDCHIGCIDEIQIGNHVLIASKVLIIDHFHGETTLDGLKLSPIDRPLISKGKILIEDNAWIGEGCVIMPGVHIGKNVVIGANSVVTKSFESNTVIGGNPAKVIRYIN